MQRDLDVSFPLLLLLALLLSSEFYFPASSWSGGVSSRRQWCTGLIAASSSGLLVAGKVRCCNAAPEPNELPLTLRDFTKLAPLGKAKRSSADKTYDLSLNEIAQRLENDLVHGATGQGGYILTGDLSTDLFRDDCAFVDPTNRVTSLSQYQKALRILFDPELSTIRMVDPLVVDEETRSIKGRYRSRGFLQLPWKPYVTAYESTIVYKIGDDGLVEEQSQSWSKSASKALKESFTPSLFTPAPASLLPASPTEPETVTRLFEYVNGRRMDEYSQEERFEIADLIENVVNSGYPSDYRRDLPGKWRLVYLQPGPDGAGIDRRIPFLPDFSFNDNYQIFSPDDHVTNVGELFGPWMDVRVFGDVNAVSGGGDQGPQRFQANIQGGKLCAGSSRCLPLPISGEGLFDSVYLGERLRIGQNLNGGGARVVQVRIE